MNIDGATFSEYEVDQVEKLQEWTSTASLSTFSTSAVVYCENFNDTVTSAFIASV